MRPADILSGPPSASGSAPFSISGSHAHVKLVIRHIGSDYLKICKDRCHTLGMKELYAERNRRTTLWISENIDSGLHRCTQKPGLKIRPSLFEKVLETGLQGFEPWKWRSQSPLPYHLAIAHHLYQQSTLCCSRNEHEIATADFIITITFHFVKHFFTFVFVLRDSPVTATAQRLTLLCLLFPPASRIPSSFFTKTSDNRTWFASFT